MGNKNKSKLSIMSIIRNITVNPLLQVAIIAIAVIIVITGLYWLNKDNSISIEENKKIDLTPTMIKSIEDIGEWEFLQINDEELADTTKQGFFGDSELVRIYYGTLRLGINLHETNKDWLKVDNDTIKATLPQIKLLDNDFIDEARTKPFSETGTWTDKDRKALYTKAYKAMKSRCMTTKNINKAKDNARIQFDNILHSMGFEYVKIRFDK
ncbi:DUF4230 domain-containing protein [Prevotella herbatica]|uniref:DUF4230 domain-containing protein n=1 Tax=Prevotella herbatica TaxID=2801997 RepID=A0ABN6EJD2_9BACT|nr:DUF4230 domain-containing protein [Prevotella herbatica]BCS86035.1 DUF4230 domain-containing protein [Prevotella herbatica]